MTLKRLISYVALTLVVCVVLGLLTAANAHNAGNIALRNDTLDAVAFVGFNLALLALLRKSIN